MRSPVLFALCLSGLMAISITGCGYRHPAISAAEPETGQMPAETVSYQKSDTFMVVTAHHQASQAARIILRQGGSAMDAAIAAQMVLNVVEPQSSGIGGGGFLVSFDADTHRVDVYDGRETAPMHIAMDAFLDAEKKPRGFIDASTGGQAVGVPGLVAMLHAAHKDHGRLDWPMLFSDAILLSENGFRVSPRLHQSLAHNRNVKDLSPSFPFFDKDNAPLAIGTIVYQPQLAKTLSMIAKDPIASFYHGSIARDIVAAVRSSVKDPGTMTMMDIAAYRPKQRAPLCRHYRGRQVCGAPPPTSGTLAILQMLSVLSHFPCCHDGILDSQTIALVSAVQEIIYRERGRHLGDPDYVSIDIERRLDPERLYNIAKTILPSPSTGVSPPQAESQSTTHISIVDGHGNAVALTSSIGPAFGSKLSAAGFLLNGELTDFSFRPELDGRPHANRVEGGKRPLSSMSPMIVLDDKGNLKMVIGSPGGTSIIAYVLQVLVAVLDYDMPIQDAVRLPHYLNRRGIIELEEGYFAEQARHLEKDGHTINYRKMTSGLHAITIAPTGKFLEGAADPRREGVALGP